MRSPPWFGLLLGAAATSGLACSDQIVHLFVAQRYDPSKNCLEKGGVVDVVEGPDPGTCSKDRCWVSAADNEAFVTRAACDAPPTYRDETPNETDSEGSVCSRALEALHADGGSPCPSP